MSTADRHVGVERARRRSVAVLEGGSASANFSGIALWPKAVPQRAIAGRPAGPIGYVLDRLPQASQGFVRDEILELGRYGVRVHVFVLDPAGDSVADPWIDGAAPSMSRIPASAFLSEAGVESTPARIIRAQAAWIARHVTARGIDHLHATQLATVDVVREVKRMTGVRYSFGVAGSEIYDDARDSRTLRAQGDRGGIRRGSERGQPAAAPRRHGPGSERRTSTASTAAWTSARSGMAPTPSMIRARCWRSVRSSRTAASPI